MFFSLVDVLTSGALKYGVNTIVCVAAISSMWVAVLKPASLTLLPPSSTRIFSTVYRKTRKDSRVPYLLEGGMYRLHYNWDYCGVLISEPKDVSLHFRGWYALVSMEVGPQDVSLLDRCPHFSEWYAICNRPTYRNWTPKAQNKPLIFRWTMSHEWRWWTPLAIFAAYNRGSGPMAGDQVLHHHSVACQPGSRLERWNMWSSYNVSLSYSLPYNNMHIFMAKPYLLAYL